MDWQGYTNGLSTNWYRLRGSGSKSNPACMSVRTFKTAGTYKHSRKTWFFIPAHDRRLLHGRYASQDERNIKLIFLNTRCRLIGECNVSEGTIDSALVSPRELFIEAFKRNAYGIILLHNHPGGDPTPSREDVMITRRIYEAGELLGIRLFDHIVIGDNCFVSMKEKGFFGK
mgnify:CR=1 FL=1